MKIHGKEVEKNSVETVVFPRKNENIVFKAKPVMDFDDFEKLCPEPQPKTKMIKGGKIVKDITDPAHIKELDEYASNKTHWMMMESLSATPGLEWDTVDMSDHSTWGNYMKELEEIDLSPIEINKLFEIIHSACGLNQDKIDEATKSFLAGEEGAQEEDPSQKEEPPSTPSGDHANSSS